MNCTSANTSSLRSNSQCSSANGNRVRKTESEVASFSDDCGNPLRLDYSGADFARTFLQDQQEYQNQRELVVQQRAIHAMLNEAKIRRNMEESDRQKKFQMPDQFRCDENEFFDSKPPPSWTHTSNLKRTYEKPENVVKIQSEFDRRYEAIRRRMRRQMCKTTSGEPSSPIIADKINMNRKQHQLRLYPHSLRDTLRFRNNLTRGVRTHARKWELKNRLMKASGIQTNSEIGTDTLLSEVLSSDEVHDNWSIHSGDEDMLTVGRRFERDRMFKLRGFHCAHNIRGKNTSKGDEMPKKFQTREEWVRELLQGSRSSTQLKSKRTQLKCLPPEPRISQFKSTLLDYIHQEQSKCGKMPSQKINAQVSGRVVRYTSARAWDKIQIQKTKLATLLNAETVKQQKELFKFREPALKSRQQQMSKHGEISKIPTLITTQYHHIHPPNVKMPKSKFVKLFKSRHHHEHHDPTYHTELLVKHVLEKPMNLFDDTNCEDTVQESPGLNTPNPNAGWEIPDADDNNKYLLKMKETYDRLINSLQHADIAEYEESISLDKQSIENIEDEIASIKSCVSSELSSVCTNFTNDSGSFILIDGTKVSLRHITKPSVPFEKTDCRYVVGQKLPTFETVDTVFKRTTHLGQLLEMKAKAEPTDRIFTASTRRDLNRRSRAGLAKASGPEEAMLAGFAVCTATRFDHNYIKILRSRISRKISHKNTVLIVRQMLRSKLETLYMTNAIVKQQIREKRDGCIFSIIKQWYGISNNIFAKLQESSFRASVKANEILKPYYEENEKLLARVTDLRTQVYVLKNEILTIEYEIRERTVCQKVHYLLMNENWRQTHDWLHKTNENRLEHIRESIANRQITHLRKRDTDNAWAVKEFYQNNFFDRPGCKTEIVFTDASEFESKIEDLKSNIQERMDVLNKRLCKLCGLKIKFRLAQQSAEKNINVHENKLDVKRLGQSVMDKRLLKLHSKTVAISDEQLPTAVKSEILQRLSGICDAMFTAIVPVAVRDFVRNDATSIEKFGIIVERIQELLWKLDNVPPLIQARATRKVRKQRLLIQRQSRRAYELGERITATMEQLKRNMEPPAKMTRPPGKLKRYYLRKRKVQAEVVQQDLPRSMQIYRKAFDEIQPEDKDDPLLNFSVAKPNNVPFHLDYFLTKHGYLSKSGEFRTQIEKSDGPEENRFKYDDARIKAMRRFKLWLLATERQKNDEIIRSSHLYE